MSPIASMKEQCAPVTKEDVLVKIELDREEIIAFLVVQATSPNSLGDRGTHSPILGASSFARWL